MQPLAPQQQNRRTPTPMIYAGVPVPSSSVASGGGGGHHAHIPSHGIPMAPSSTTFPHRVRRTNHHSHHHSYPASVPPPQIHSSLLPGSFEGYDIRWTLSHRPHHSSQPAITPPLSHIILHSPYLSSSWNIHVHAPSHKRSYITILDVLQSIHTHLRTPVTSTEYHTFASTSQRVMRRVNLAYEKRYNMLAPGDREREKKRGVRRVDFLMEHVRFVGLVPTQKSDTWIYQMAPG